MKHRALIFVIFLCVLAVLYAVARQHVTWETLVEQEAELRAWMSRHPWRGLGIGFALYVVVSLVPGTTGKALVVGWLYGFWLGLVLVNVGLTVAALISFFASRYGCRALVEARCGPRVARVNDALEREGAGYLFAARVLHVPYCLTNYVMGATAIPWRGFWWSTQLGLLPGNVVFVYAGSQAPTLAELAEQGLASLLSPGLIAAFVAVSIVPLLIRSVVRRMLPRPRDAR
jgi:uncharacterized membrane protein YdjX (TVP38/TMEM64 family)